MTTAIIKILSGKQNVGKETLTLTVDFIKGMAVENDFVFLRVEFFNVFPYPIKKIKKQLSGDKYELTIHFPEMKWMWKDRIEKHITSEDNTAFCGISIDNYHTLDTEAKVSYYLSIVDLLGVDRVPDYIKANYRLGIKLMPDDIGEDTGFTKFGGLPLASNDFVFPKDRNGHSAIFIGQIHIKELNEWVKATKEFSNDGALYLFGTVVDYDGYYSFGDLIVKYSNNVSNTEQVNLPADLNKFGTLKEYDMRIVEEINIPPQKSSLWIDTEMTGSELNSYWHLQEILRGYTYFNSTKILGHPNQIQGCTLLEAELKHNQLGWFANDYNPNDQEGLIRTMNENIPKCRDWRLLLEMDGDAFSELSAFEGTFNKYNDGTYYMMIKQTDLDNMNFDNVETIYQCT